MNFSRKYPKANSYLDIANYREDDPKGVFENKIFYSYQRLS